MTQALATNIPVQTEIQESQTSEAILIERAQMNPEEFEPLYEKYYERIYLYLLRRCANTTLAEDLTGDTFFKAIHSLPRFKQQNVPFLAWLFRIAHNQMISHYRKVKVRDVFRIKKQRENKSYTDPRIHMLRKTELDQTGTSLAKIIQQLKPIDQLLISLRFIEDLSMNETADAAGMTTGSARTRLHRALKKLKILIENDAPEIIELIGGTES